MRPDWHTAVDIGGTFTDLLAVDRKSGRYTIEKVLTTHFDPSAAVADGLRKILDRAGISAAQVRNVVHATTLVTNAIIERRGAPTALLITEGFRDTLIIGREHRYDMYDLLLEKPAPLASRRNTFGVPERILADGTVFRSLDDAAVRAIARELRDRGIGSAAICLLHAFRNPGHEIRVRDILIDGVPGIRVATSHEVVGELREYERASTTVANAYTLEIVDEYLGRIESYLATLGHSGALYVMLSSGATATTSIARTFPVRLIESGPAAGALAAAEAGRRIGVTELLSFDMGGTTAKACVIEGGRPTIANELEVDRLQRFKRGSGIPLEISSVELIEIGAGGGSLARLDRFGLLQVGPESAGSDPGPVCYGHGGTVPTVTDADLLLGYLAPDYFLGGAMELDYHAAERAVSRELAEPMGLTTVETAWMIHEVVNENMANAARVHAVERGSSLSELPLFAFGGAGPVHAYRVAKNLGLRLMIIPLGAGVGSTIGLLAAPIAFDFVRTSVSKLDSIDWLALEPLVEEMEMSGVTLLEAAGVAYDQCAVEHSVDMRLLGQAHEITVPIPEEAVKQRSPDRIGAAFQDTYAALFGRQPPSVPIEVVSWRVRVAAPQPAFPIQATGEERRDGHGAPVKSSRDAYFPEAGGFVPTPVYDRYELQPGDVLEGPAIIEERESTTVLGPGSRIDVDAFLNLIVRVL